MIFLLFAILLGSLFAVVFKVCQNKGIDVGQVIMFNYLTAFLLSVIPVAINIAAGNAAFREDYMLPVECALPAVIQGFFFFFGFKMMDRSTWRNGVALTTASARASLIIPVILSWLLLGQSRPNWLAVALILGAMMLMVLPSRSAVHDPSLQTGISERKRKTKTMLALVSVFLTYGISDFSLKTVQHSV